jgi:cytochrome P450
MLNRRDTSLPGGPRTPRVIQTISWGLAPVAYYRRCRRRHGSAFTMRVLGLGDIVVVSEPAQVREVFGGDPEVMHAGEANAVMRPVLGDGSLLLLDGERHLRSRRLLLGPFHGDLAARHCGPSPSRSSSSSSPATSRVSAGGGCASCCRGCCGSRRSTWPSRRRRCA